MECQGLKNRQESNCITELGRLWRPFILLWILSIALPLVLSSNSKAAKKSKLSPDELAWQQVLPEVEVFWHEYQTSPHKLSDEVWPFISVLKEFIRRYPGSPRIAEAYYLLGEAYAAANYWPEAVAHWKIVIRYHPDSKWTSAALNSLVAYLEKQGDQDKLKKFYKDILRQFPDSIAAKTTRVLLARHALQEGKIDLVKRVIRDIERSSPSAGVEIPELLDLKAMIARKEGRRQDALRLWIHFVNLKKSPVARASALFQIAETYRSSGDWLKARKYYALIRRDFSSQPEALFAKFRLLQMSEAQRERMARYVKGKKLRPVNLNESERVFQKIVRRFPNYFLTQEVRKELIATKIKKGEYMKALELADDFVQTSPKSAFVHDVLALSDKAAERLISGNFTADVLEQNVSAGRNYLNRKPQNKVQEHIQKVTQKLWVRLIKELLKEKRPLDALEKYWSYTRSFQKHSAALKEAFSAGLRALEQTDRWFLSQKRYADLVNYDFFHEQEIETMKSPVHYHLLARSFSMLGLDKMALRAYFAAWKLRPSGRQRCEILRDWAGQSINSSKMMVTQDTIGLLDMLCPDYSLQPDVLYFKSVMASRQGDFIAAFNMAKDSMSARADEKNVYQAMFSGIVLGEWQQLEDIYRKNSKLLPLDKRVSILKQWGDEAVRFSEFQKAMVPYGFLADINSEDPSLDFRLAVAESGAYGFEKARSRWEDLSKKDLGIWSKAAKSELSFYKFMGGPAGQL